MPFVHITARTLPWRLSLLDTHVADWLWQKLRGGFPGAVAVCLMPRHLHLVAEVESSVWARERLRRTLAWHARRFGPSSVFRVWEPVPEPSEIIGSQKLARQVRYVALNPCRAGMSDDPLSWFWSTHRDVVGAVVRPWVDATRLAGALEQPADGFQLRHHAYVSSDPSASVVGTPPPEPAEPTRISRQPLVDVSTAVLAASRARPEALQLRSPVRRTFIHLAARQGWGDPSRLAAHCGMTVESVRSELRRHQPTSCVAAAALCLGDDRLLRPYR